MAFQPMRVDWVASPPPGAYPHRRLSAPPRPYAGPPSYPVPPRWGFPLLAWRWPTSVAGEAAEDSVEQVQRLARTSFHVLGLAALTMLWAAGSEIWRYVLLLQSRYGALSSTTVDVSDAMLRSASTLALIAVAGGVVFAFLWLRRARIAAASAAGYGPSRSDAELLVGLLVPGLNLVMAGSIAAELEHAALRLPATARPSPSPLVRWWWGLWAGAGLWAVVTVAWSFRSSVQARADGVLLHAVSDLLATAVIVLTMVLVRRITSLLLPVEASTLRRMRVVELRDAPAPELRTVRSHASPR